MIALDGFCARTLIVSALASALLACGGGGGGGGTPARLVSVNPSPLELEAFVDTTSPSAAVVLTFGGDLSWLYQQQLWLYFLYDEPVFGTTVDLSAGPDYATQITAALHGVDGLSQGPHSGDLEVHACLDSACHRELDGSPTLVHYSIDMLNGLELGQPSLVELQPFGTHLTRRVTVNVPKGTGTQGTLGLAVDASNWMNGFSAHVAEDDPSSIDVEFPLRSVGQYEQTFHVTASAPDPTRTGFVLSWDVPLDVVYDITANPGVPIVTTASQFSYTKATGNCDASYGDFGVVFQDAADTSLVTHAFEYVSHPAAADTHAGVAQWLDGLSAVDIAFQVLPCPTSGGQLPPGPYRAVIHVTHPNGGSPYRIDVPVNLDITP